MMKMKEIDAADMLVIAVLGATLLLATWRGMSELSTNIASGLIGYMAKTAVGAITTTKNNKGGV